MKIKGFDKDLKCRGMQFEVGKTYSTGKKHSAQTEKKGCEYCKDVSRYKGFGYAEYFHQTAVDEMYEISIDVKFCPNCGRKITREAAAAALAEKGTEK